MHIGLDARMYGIQHRGIGRYVQRLLEHLAKLDDNHRYTLFMGSDTAASFRLPGGKFKVVKADVPWYSLREHLAMPRLVRASRVDIMHWPHINVPYWCPVPYAVTVHDLIVWHWPDSRATTLPAWQYQIKLWAYRRILRRAAAGARVIMAVSNFTKRDLVRQLGLDEPKIRVIYPGTDKMVLGTAQLANPASFVDYLQKSFGIRRPYLLYVGSAYPHKNLENLCRAFAQLRFKYNRYWQLVLVGREDYFYKNLKAWLAANVPDLVIGDDIVFTGQVSDKDLDGLYRSARLFVFPSLYEGFGLPPLEAAARGRPVAASYAASLPEVLADAVYYFDPHSADNMAQAIDTAGGLASLREELSGKGLERAQHFSWEKMAKETVAVYESFVV